MIQLDMPTSIYDFVDQSDKYDLNNELLGIKK
jgi:hypothetical protein